MVWRGSLAIAMCVAALSGLSAASDPGSREARMEIALRTGWVACLALLLGGSVALCWRWWLVRQAAAGWLAAVAVCASTYLTSCSFRLDGSLASRESLGAVNDVDVVMFAAWMIAAWVATRRPASLPQLGPIALGLLLGLAGVGLELVFLDVDSANVLPGGLASRVAIGVMGAVALLALARAHGFTARMKRQSILVCGLATMSRVMAPAVPTHPGIWSTASLLCGIAAASLFCGEAFALLAGARRQVDTYSQIADAVSTGTDDAEQLHELRASFAGLATAIRVLASHDQDLSHTRRVDLTSMLETEADRLERLINGTPTGIVQNVDLDALLESLVASRRLVGQQIDWQRSGCHLRGSPDLIASAVSMLLVNAAVHAPGIPVRLTATQQDGVVRVRVRDRGPGVPQPLRRTLFARGARSASSPGSGIGLHFARRIVRAQGGALRLVDDPAGPGATFELTLPSTGPAAEPPTGPSTGSPSAGLSPTSLKEFT